MPAAGTTATDPPKEETMASLNELIDLDALRAAAGDDAAEAGMTCAQSDCVRYTQSSPRQVTGTVRDGQHMYNTTLRVVDDQLDWACNCGDLTRERPCKHVVALAAMLEGVSAEDAE